VGTSRLEAVFLAACRKRNGTAQALVLLFLAEKENARARGFKLTDDVRLSIAAQA